MRVQIFGWELIIQRIPIPEASNSSKKEPKKQKPIQKCYYRDKRMFTREQAAEEVKAINKPGIRFYCCEFCNMWHLTHHKRYKTY